MAGSISITAVLEPRGPAGALILSDSQAQSLDPARKVFPVKVSVNGHEFDGRVASMGGERMIGFSKAIRAACGVEVGDTIEAEIRVDDAPREVDLPAELTAALASDATAKSNFEALSYSRRKENARAIAEAKKPETRERRLAKLLTELRG